MKKQLKSFISFFLVVCAIFSSLFISQKAKAEGSVLTSDSIYYLDGTYIYDVAIKTPVSDFIKNINSSISVYNADGQASNSSDYITTGNYFTLNGVKYTVVLSGDVDSSGIIDSTDYLKIKSYFMGKLDFSELMFKAADIDGSEKIDSSDYLKIKSAFLGKYILPSSTEYYERKSIAANIFDASEKLSALTEIEASLSLNAITDAENVNISADFKANKFGTEKPDFSFRLDAVSGEVNYPLGEAYYGNGKYKVEASFADVSEFLSNYFVFSPVDENGSFILVPHVDKEKNLGKDYRILSGCIDTMNKTATSDGTDYSFATFNVLNSEQFYKIFQTATGSETFGGVNIRNVFESVSAKGTIHTNKNGVVVKSEFTVDVVTTDEAMARFGEGTPKNMTLVYEINYTVDSPVTVTMPDATQYVTVDSIYTPYAFTAYEKAFETASGMSSKYSEKLTVNGKETVLDAYTNVKNVSKGVELYKNTSVTKDGKAEIKELYIGDLKYIEKIGNSKTVTDLNTESLSVEKTANFSYPQLNSLSDIENLTTFALTENGTNYTLTYTLKKEAVIEILGNSALVTDNFNYNNYKVSDYTLENALGSITFTKQTFEVVSDSLELSLTLSDGNKISYEYDFSVITTDCTKINVDKSLLN